MQNRRVGGGGGEEREGEEGRRCPGDTHYTVYANILVWFLNSPLSLLRNG